MDYIYTKVNKENLSENLISASSKTINSPFGVSFVLKEGGMEVYIITPPSAGIEGSDEAPVEQGRFESYEVFLEKPSFLSIKSESFRGLRHRLSNLSKFLLPNEKVVIQMAARKLLGVTWKEELLDMYSSYLRGNDSPLSSPIGRRVQEKAVTFLSRIGSFETTKEYIEETEEKILDTGYEFKMIVGIESKETEDIAQRIKDIFTKYNFYNSLKMSKSSQVDMINTLKVRERWSTSANRNILSEKELLSLLSGSEEEPSEINANVPTKSRAKNSRFDFLPKRKIPQKTLSDSDKVEIFSKVSEALKRVGVISTARLYNSKIIEGLRLIVVQFDIPKGKNLSHITKKRKDIQAVLGVQALSIEQGNEPDTVKITIPNDKPSVIGLREVIEQDSFEEFRKKEGLPFVVGVDEDSNPIYLSLSKLVHLMVAGTTGSGKSVFINSLATTLIATHTPEELQMVMIDPKMVELQHYANIPHVRDVITDMSQAEVTLSELVEEMESRYKEFQRAGVKNIELYNKSDKRSGSMPYLVCVIDEYADLKDSYPDVEDYIARIGQKARASGIHMVIATQRPDAKVISGRIKAVIPNAVSFNLNNNNDYRTVFGFGIGDVTLLGRGDGIMKIEGHEKQLQRFQSCIISIDESEEEKVYKKLEKLSSSSLNEEAIEEYEPLIVVEEEAPESNEQLNKLKGIIATTKETRAKQLRSKMGIRTERLSELMRELVDAGWLRQHKSRNRGYELVASEEELNKWKE